jgi:hypothetical protein
VFRLLERLRTITLLPLMYLQHVKSALGRDQRNLLENLVT